LRTCVSSEIKSSAAVKEIKVKPVTVGKVCLRHRCKVSGGTAAG